MPSLQGLHPARMHRSSLKFTINKIENLTPEQREKALACKSTEEVLALAKQEGYELSDDELEQASGGWGDDARFVACVECGWNVLYSSDEYHVGTMKCPDCGYEIRLL